MLLLHLSVLQPDLWDGQELTHITPQSRGQTRPFFHPVRHSHAFRVPSSFSGHCPVQCCPRQPIQVTSIDVLDPSCLRCAIGFADRARFCSCEGSAVRLPRYKEGCSQGVQQSLPIPNGKQVPSPANFVHVCRTDRQGSDRKLRQHDLVLWAVIL